MKCTGLEANYPSVGLNSKPANQRAAAAWGSGTVRHTTLALSQPQDTNQSPDPEFTAEGMTVKAVRQIHDTTVTKAEAHRCGIHPSSLSSC